MRNYVHSGERIYLTVGTDVKAGDPVAVGQIVGVALNDADASGGTVVITRGVFRLPVKGNDGTADVDVAVGDQLYIKDGVISKDSSGVPFGYALGTVAAGATTEIEVKVNC